MENLFYIKGQEIKHSMYFGTSKGKNVELIGGISDWHLERFDKENVDKHGVQIYPSLDLISGKISLYTTWVLVTEYRVANEKETELFNSKMAEKNLVYEKRNYVNVNIFREGKISKIEKLTTYYKSKDDFRIVLGDKVVTYKELKNMQFADDDKIVLSGDNGYSHCWESTTKLDSVFGYIDCLFDIPSKVDKKDNFHALQSIARVGEHWGYKFNDYGELVLRVTKQDRNVSQVSFS